jgi:hypothetical protein
VKNRKIYKNSQDTIKIKKLLNYIQKKCLILKIGKFNIYSQIRNLTIFFAPRPTFIKNSQDPHKIFFFWPKQKKYVFYDIE